MRTSTMPQNTAKYIFDLSPFAASQLQSLRHVDRAELHAQVLGAIDLGLSKQRRQAFLVRFLHQHLSRTLSSTYNVLIRMLQSLPLPYKHLPPPLSPHAYRENSSTRPTPTASTHELGNFRVV